jgi:hypothetical protein
MYDQTFVGKVGTGVRMQEQKGQPRWLPFTRVDGPKKLVRADRLRLRCADFGKSLCQKLL